ncbi:MAG: hypothetical protein HY304_09020 [candidate division Zixibacteria bacterium]|nr:hypothetical protein [candidate division Zixibacteria bacterium]
MIFRHRIVRLVARATLATAYVVLGAGLTFAKPGPKPVSMRFAHAEIPVVLGSLASQVGFDLVIAPNVQGQIDVNLNNVDWETALSAIVTANHLSYHWRDDVLVILPTDSDADALLEHRVVSLHYADPSAVKAALTSALSPHAKVDLLGMTATAASVASSTTTTGPMPVLVISETPQAMPQVLALIDSLDVPRPQFEIGVKFIETTLDKNEDVGLSWPTEIGVSLADRSGVTGSTTATPSTPAAQYPIRDGKIWRFGTLSVDQLSGFLGMLSSQGKSRLLSDPRVTVLENQKAVMRVATTIPVQTLNRFSEGGTIQDIVSFQDLDVGITLSVTPRRNDSNQVTLDVEPVVEEITGFTGPVDNQRPITSKRTVHTVVRVNNNETIVIGGLVRENEISTKTRLFLLGDIPILGELFTHRKIEKVKSDLLIFITPRILEDVAAR